MKTMKTIEEVKAAVERGETVHWKSLAYTVRKDKHGDWWVDCITGFVTPMRGHKAEDFMTTLPKPQPHSARLRAACKFLSGLADEADALLGDSTHPTALPQQTVRALREYEEDFLEPGDLMAIRDASWHYHPEPYGFLWMLHRYQNHLHPFP